MNHLKIYEFFENIISECPTNKIFDSYYLKKYFLYHYNPHYYSIFKVIKIIDDNFFDIKREMEFNLSRLSPPIEIKKTYDYSDIIISVSFNSNIKKNDIIFTSDNMDELVDRFTDIIELKNNIKKYNL
jgi:hypothetical protein